MSYPVYLVDASIYIFRYYFSLPDNRWTDDGYSSAAVYGYSLWLIRLLETTRATHIAACFDESLGSCFRNSIYPDYKCSRALPDEALAFQLNACKTMTEFMGIPSYASNTHEADDLLATLALRCRKKDQQVCIVSRDKDLAQIILGENDTMWDAPHGERLSSNAIEHSMGIKPQQVADYLALIGDVSDDIPGVPGLGPKTAASLLSYFSNWSELNNNLHKIPALPIRSAVKLAKKLSDYSAQIELAIQLTQLDNRAPLGRRFTTKRKAANRKTLIDFADKLGFGKIFHTSLKRVFP
ncbi:5'-3' exonuclease [Teredinibacter haidensis]|uniref:5'-3' exonuclease n=1 Tax=Teredinibacter haidensis TaxID=2731755 RepID=UPI000948ACFB|nr:5'-3' exonuclease H3TH domain-containing protein [Teredinibacter haidensis]